jgi:hypothetical protein
VRADVPAWLVSASKSFAPEASPGMLQWFTRMVEENSIWAMVHASKAEVETDWRTELPAVFSAGRAVRASCPPAQ